MINGEGVFKITLRQNNNVIGFIDLSYSKEDAVPGQGFMITTQGYRWKLTWNVGHCMSNIVAPPGEYYIRVFNLKNNEFSNSQPFTIYEIKAQQVPEGLKKAKKIKQPPKLPQNYVTSPKYNYNWRIGSVQSIKWTTEAVPGNYKIILRRNNQKVEEIKDGVSSYQESQDGKSFVYKWNWTKAGHCKNGVVAEPGANYKIRILFRVPASSA